VKITASLRHGGSGDDDSGGDTKTTVARDDNPDGELKTTGCTMTTPTSDVKTMGQ
jgi:hypothetical protein